MPRIGQLFCVLLFTLAAIGVPTSAAASQYYGQVTFQGWPVPGVTITLAQGTKRLSTVTDQGGLFRFADLTDDSSKITIEMQCFRTIEADVLIGPNMPAGKWELTLLPLDEIMARTKPVPNPSATVRSAEADKKSSTTDSSNNLPSMPKPQVDSSEESADGLLVNGSVNNAATSKFSLDQAFGNRKPNGKSLYTGGLAVIFDNSALDARQYSLSGLEPPKPFYNRITGAITLGGPIKIPHLLPHGPIFFVAYQWTRDQTAETDPALVPTAAERMGNLAGLLNAVGQPVTVFNPATGLPFAGNMVPVSPQAQALLQLYPAPNIPGNSLYNYQRTVVNDAHHDALQSRLDKTFGHKDEVYGGFNFQSINGVTTNLFGFTDTTAILGTNANVNWAHRFSQHLFLYVDYQFSRLRTNSVPYFENRQNVSGAAGIIGNDQTPTSWGPPALIFSSGIAALSDAQSSFNRARTDAFSGSTAVYHRRHNLTFGGDFRRQQFNDFFQQDPRGTFSFTGTATQDPTHSVTASGSDLADFLIGVPDASSVAFGNADKYLRESVYDAYATDDWHVRSMLTINAGLRWQYGAPITEIHARLVNLDVAPDFTAVAPVLGSNPVGPLTGIKYPSSLIRPDWRGFEPRVGIAWRPILASTVVVRAGYGIYHDTSVYQTSALALAQQAPLSKSLSVQNSGACPLTLANGFKPCSATTSDTFAVDPNFRVGYAQIWRLSLQRDLPAALQLLATYNGIKGTHGVQQFLPNTYAIGAANPCPTCPAGFVYQTSGGNSTRQAGQVQLRRRLRGGFTATLLYTYSKSIDDDALLGGLGHVNASAQSQGSNDSGSSDAPTQSTSGSASAIAQNWLNLRGERSLSSFDQRHLLNFQVQYTSGEGLGGRTLMTGWPGRFFKGWTFLSAVVAGSGLPETPTYLATVPGTGFLGTIRSDLTGAPIYTSGAAPHLNAAAFAAPPLGQWGTAGRNSVAGPGQFTLDSSLARTFRPSTHFYLDARVDATNLLNHVVYAGWNTTVNSAQFGLPLAANPMRSLEISLRLRF